MNAALRYILPERLRNFLRLITDRLSGRPAVGQVRFGSLARLTPIGRNFGLNRGQAVDRYYIEGFVDRHREDVRGRVLEIGEDTYTRRYGGDRVAQADVLHAEEGNPTATIVADLTDAPQIASDTYDCIILTQTLVMIYDIHAVVREVYRILKPGGVVLVTVPGISMVCREETDAWHDHWHFTDRSTRRLLEESFPPECVEVESYGNIFAAIAYLHCLCQEDIDTRDLDYHDPDYQVTIGVRAMKPES